MVWAGARFGLADFVDLVHAVDVIARIDVRSVHARMYREKSSRTVDR